MDPLLFSVYSSVLLGAAQSLKCTIDKDEKNYFQLNLLSGLGFNPFSHSTYIWREGIIILPSVGCILLPMLTWGTTW